MLYDIISRTMSDGFMMIPFLRSLVFCNKLHY